MVARLTGLLAKVLCPNYQRITAGFQTGARTEVSTQDLTPAVSEASDEMTWPEEMDARETWERGNGKGHSLLQPQQDQAQAVKAADLASLNVHSSASNHQRGVRGDHRMALVHQPSRLWNDSLRRLRWTLNGVHECGQTRLRSRPSRRQSLAHHHLLLPLQHLPCVRN